MLLALCALTLKAQEKLPLKLIATTPMPSFTGDFDHFGLDLKGNRLFLTSEDQKTVEVFNLRTGERIHSIKGFGQPLTMAYLAESNRLIVTDGGDTDTVELVDCKDYKIINTLKLGQGVDHGAYNPLNGYFYVENGGGPDGKIHVLSIIDIKSFKQVGEVVGLPGNSNEGMVIDRKEKKLYVNLTARGAKSSLNFSFRAWNTWNSFDGFDLRQIESEPDSLRNFPAEFRVLGHLDVPHP